MKVSIALCTYNGEKFLLDQLNSFLSQTRMPDELIVCDDCSSDGTVQLIKEFAGKAPFPVQIHVNEKTLRTTKNFEKAVSLCTGDVIFLSDQDDVWLPQKVEIMAAEFEKSADVGLVFTDAELVDEKLKSYERFLWEITFPVSEQNKFKDGKGLDILIFGRTVTGATAAFRSDLRKAFLPIPEAGNFIHDGWIAMVACILSKIIFIDSPLIKYRQHSGQQFGAIQQLQKNTTEQKGRVKGHSRRQSYEETINRYLSQKTNLELLAGLPATLRPSSAENTDRLREYVNRAISHYSTRRDMPRNKIKRLPIVIKELTSGNYHQYSRGIKSVALDLLEDIN